MAGAGAVKLEAPPPRQRVVERDGRLVVIDSGAPASVRSAAPIPTARRRFDQTHFDGRGVLTTRKWYDLKGPRRLELDATSGRIARFVPVIVILVAIALVAAALFFPWMLVLIPALVQPKPWRRARERITARLDRFPAAR